MMQYQSKRQMRIIVQRACHHLMNLVMQLQITGTAASRFGLMQLCGCDARQQPQ